MGKRKLLLGLFISIPLLFGMAYTDDDAEEPITEEVIEQVCETWTVVKVKWFPEGSLANEIATYTYNTYWLDYLLLLRAENGTFEPDRRHNWYVKRCIKGYNEETQRRILWRVVEGKCYWERKAMYDWWLCGFNEYRHPEVVMSYKFWDRQRQVDKCVELKKGWTAFYWWSGRYKYKNDFIFTEEQKCHSMSWTILSGSNNI